MVLIGTVTGSRVDYNREDDDAKSILLQVELSGPDDVQTIELVQPSGEHNYPVVGSRVYVIQVGSSYKLVFANLTELDIEIEEGEKELFSYDDSGKLAKVKLTKDEMVLLNDGGRKVARKDDETQINIVTDETMLTWIVKVTAFINGLAPGTILPNEIPSSITGKVTQGSESVEVPND